MSVWPITSALENLNHVLQHKFGADLVSSSLNINHLVIEIKADDLLKIATFLRDDENFYCKQLIDICGVDYPTRAPQRFEVIYHFLSLKHNCRIRIKIKTNDQMPLPSLISLFPNAGWYEREVWDLYGIYFNDHPDLRRILTDYGFEGHPLRKDFPLTGYVEVRYDEEQKRVIYEPVKLPQEFRTFDFESPWEGILHISDNKSNNKKDQN
ncbi:MAG: NADH-quinone oxidoreductase subunit C [Alphaproteobacteria bacterium]|nr:NADH-quinone oxidoreductase subunit C [Alphaproteobacteria bacterium]